MKKVKRICRKCKNCRKKFYIIPSIIKKGGGKFCSLECNYIYKKGKNIKCKTCEKIFYLIPSKIKEGRIYCSRKCYTKDKNIKRKCLVCKKIFYARASSIKMGFGILCSVKCSDEYKKNGKYVKCDTCSKKFYMRLSVINRNNKNVYCSVKCYQESKNKKVKRKCKTCGKIFYARFTNVENGYGIYCSKECQSNGARTGKYVNCKYCNKRFYVPLFKIKKGEGIFCSRKCYLAGANIMTMIEKKVKNFLIKKNIPFKRQFKIKKYFYDFLITKNKSSINKLLIEVDGNYWHANPLKFSNEKLNKMQKRNIKNDNIKNLLAIKNSYNILRLWEYDINNNFEACKKKILDNI